MPTRHEIELALNSSAYRRVSQAQDRAVGSTFWSRTFKKANKELKGHIKLTTDLSEDAAEAVAKQFDQAFKESASNFGDEVEKAAKAGSQEYVRHMTRAIDKIARIQGRSDDERASTVQRIIDLELKGLQDRLKLERESEKVSYKRPGRGQPNYFEEEENNLSSRGQKFKKMTRGAGERLHKAGAKVGGGAGKFLGSAGDAIGGIGKYAAMAGAVLGVTAALGVLAKKALEVQQEMKKLNTSMTQSISASDLISAGYISVEEGVTALRKEFMENISANYKWRMSTEEAYESLNALTATGVTLGKLTRQMGRDVGGVGQTARDVVDITRTYSTQFKTGVGEIGSFMGDLMLNLNYSFSQASGALASISNESQRAGIGAGVFFGKVQSLNTQLGLMNSNLQGQARVLADIVKKGPLGLEQASQAAASIMGKLDEQAGRNLLAFVGEAKAMALARSEMERVQANLANPNIDATLRRRLEAERSQIQRALAGGMIEVMKLFEGGLTSETANLEARFAAVAKVLNKSVDSLSYKDLINVSFDQSEMLKQLGLLGGSSEDVNKNLMAMAGLIDANGGVKQALKAMDKGSMSPMKEKISEDIRLAQEMLRETEDVAKILTNIKEWMMSTLYDLLVGMYDVIIEYFGNKQDKAVLQYDKAIRKNRNNQEGKKGDELVSLQSQEKALLSERETLSGYSDEDFTKWLDAYGGGSALAGGSLKTALKSRIGDNGTGGAITGGTGTAMTPTSKLPSSARHRDPEEERRKQQLIASGENQVALGKIAWEIAKSSIASDGIDIGEALSSKQYQEFASTMPKPWQHAPAEVRILAFEDAKGLLDLDTDKANAVRQYLKALENPMAKGGIVTRPTAALIGEAGPEAVIPLKRGAGTGDLHFHVHGNIYGMSELNGMMTKAFRSFERSQRI